MKFGKLINLIFIACVAHILFLWFNETSAQTVPPPLPSISYSYYISVSGFPLGTMYQQGCTLADQLLDSSEPFVFSALLFGNADRLSNGDWGVRIYAINPPQHSINEVEDAAFSFALGYAVCSYGEQVPKLELGVGINNDVTNAADQVNRLHGGAWSNMVKNLQLRLENEPITLNQVFSVGAFNAETGFNTPIKTQRWITGFVIEPNTGNILYNLPATACPGQDDPNADNEPCGTPEYPQWMQSDVVEMVAPTTYGTDQVKVIPQIYLTNGFNAQQWYQITRYAIAHSIDTLHFAGVLVQETACQQVGGCSDYGLDNSPQDGWAQLWAELLQDPDTAPFTGEIDYSVDMEWHEPDE